MTNEEIKESITLIISQQNHIISILRIIYERLHKQDSEILDILNHYDKNSSILSKMMDK